MNILSYYKNTLLGRDIKGWIIYHSKELTEYSKIARTMTRYIYTLKDDKEYEIELRPSSTAGGKKKVRKPNIVKARIKDDDKNHKKSKKLLTTKQICDNI